MLTTQQKEAYFSQSHKYILPENAQQDNIDLAATVAANFASLTFRIPNEDIYLLAQAKREDIILFHQTYVPILERALYADNPYSPRYQNFPEEIMRKSYREIFLGKLLYGLTGYEFRQDVYEKEKDAFSFLGYANVHIQGGSEKDYTQSVQQIAHSQKAFSPSQIEYLKVFYTQYPDAKHHLPDATKLQNHENRAILASILTEAHIPTKQITPFLSDTNDILRYAVIQASLQEGNHKDAYSYAALRQKNIRFKFPRTIRRTVVSALENNAKKYGENALEQQLISKKSLWKQLIRTLHISDYPWAKYTAKAFEAISTNKPIQRNLRSLETAIQNKNLKDALLYAKRQPDEFARRLDKLIRMVDEQEASQADKLKISDVLKAYEEIAPQVSLSTLCNVAAHIQNRTHPNETRRFQIPSSHTVFGKPDERPAFAPYVGKMVINTTYNAITEQMRGKQIFDKESAVYISPQTEQYKIPTDIQKISEGINTYTKGSQVDISTSADYQRFYAWWTNTTLERMNVDLTMTGLDKHGNVVTFIGPHFCYHAPDNAAYARGRGHADLSSGKASFLDVNLTELEKMGVTTLIPQVRSWASPFCDMPNIAFGYMDRERLYIDREALWPSDIEEQFKRKFKLNAKAYASLVGAIHLNGKETIDGKTTHHMSLTWIDEPIIYTEALRGGGIDNMIKAVEAAENYPTPSIADMVRLNAQANEIAITESPENANYLFVTAKELDELKAMYPDVDFSQKEIIAPNNLDYIVGSLMQPAITEPEQHLEEPSKKPLGEALSDFSDVYSEINDLFSDIDEILQDMQDSLNNIEKLIEFDI